MLTSNTEGLNALHRVLIKARFRAGEGASGAELYAILDRAESLLADILSPDDQTELFEEDLRALGEEFQDLAGISEDYEARLSSIEN